MPDPENWVYVRTLWGQIYRQFQKKNVRTPRLGYFFFRPEMSGSADLASALAQTTLRAAQRVENGFISIFKGYYYSNHQTPPLHYAFSRVSELFLTIFESFITVNIHGRAQ
jgi:hypothetical protein